MGNFGKSRKGSLLDLIFIAFVLMFFGIVVLVGLKIGTEFKDRIDDMDNMPVESKTAAEDTITKYTYTIDKTFLFFTIFLGIATLTLAALVRIHPIFIPFYFIGWIIVIFLSGIFSNLYQHMAADANLIATANQLTFISNILASLPIIVGVVGICLMVVMYKLWSVQQEF